MLNSIVEYVATLLAFIIVDHDEGWKPTLFNNGISSKQVVSLAFDLEDKITFKGVGNDMINVVMVQCLLTNMLYNEKIIWDTIDIEVEKLRKTMHKRISWFCVHKFMKSTNEISEATKVVFFVYVGYHGYIALLRRRKRTEWDPGRQLRMCIIIWSFKFKQWDPGKICVVSNFYNLEDKVDLKG
jgi:hypothetical protein